MNSQFTIKVKDLTPNTCVECNRSFDMSDEDDAAEWSYGHDCEV